MKQWLMEHKLYFVVPVFIILGTVYYFFNQKPPESNAQFAQLEKQSAEKVEAKEQTIKPLPNEQKQPAKTETIFVDVKGAVKKPGVYQANENERVNDIILRAGGLGETADASQVNFAARVQDEMVIYVPVKGETNPPVPQASANASPPPQPGSTTGSQPGNGKVNLNKANESDLETLPGVGPAKAAAIIEYRKQNGSFQSPEDLKKISGIGDKTFEKLKDLITVQ
ncbi:helix-hairpin-helix domain-containing protein [Neobacillus sp. SM06]|uniref:helix-hairpin-helix domain-containing protein n=1 Tax=Neobacillus sp. SM06 TaxID=3422492 RepID=UPI003D2E8C3E